MKEKKTFPNNVKTVLIFYYDISFCVCTHIYFSYWIIEWSEIRLIISLFLKEKKNLQRYVVYIDRGTMYVPCVFLST